MSLAEEGNSRIQAEQEAKRREEVESGIVAGTSLAPIHAQKKKKGKLETTSMVVDTKRRKRMKRGKMEN